MMRKNNSLDFVVPGVERYRFTANGWVLVGTTCPPEDTQPEVVNKGCAECDKALDSISMDQLLRLSGIHCTLCGQLRRAPHE